MTIDIDHTSGFCFGVQRAIQTAEEHLRRGGTLFSLGHIVHNEQEEARLQAMGLKVIERPEFEKLHDATVLIRAHGEPPETYRIARHNNLHLIDATCPVVKKLQAKVKDARQKAKQGNGQVVIYGRHDHPEVIGLAGNAGNQVIVVEKVADVKKIDLHKPVYLFAQTTKNPKVYRRIFERIESGRSELKTAKSLHFVAEDSICRQVSGREPHLHDFAAAHDVLVFVGGEHSSNARQLFGVCHDANPRSHFISNVKQLEPAWFEDTQTVGISGATSTPQWLIRDVAAAIKNMSENKSAADVS